MSYCIDNSIQMFDDMQNNDHVWLWLLRTAFSEYLLEGYWTQCSYKVEGPDMQLCGLV